MLDAAHREMIPVNDQSTVDPPSATRRFDRAYYLYRFGAGGLRWIPRPIARALMNAIGLVAAQLASSSRATVEANLRRVLGDSASPELLTATVRRSFMSYARYWSDVAHLPSIERRELLSLFDEEALLRFERDVPRGAAVLALPHLGAWEIGGLWARERGVRMHSVAEPASSERLTSWFTRQRERLGLEVMPLGRATVAELLGALGRNELVALLADRDVVGDGVRVEFFDAPTTMPGGPAMLALRSGAPLLPCAVYHDANDQHRPVLMDAIPTDRRGRLREDIVRVTQELANAFEALIKEAPEQWHVFQPQWPADRPGGR